MLGLVIGSALTQVTEEERKFREGLFVTPEAELIPKEMKKTKRTVAAFMLLGVIVAFAMIRLWVIPYYNAL